MDRSLIFRALLIYIFILVFPSLVRAGISIRKGEATVQPFLKSGQVFLTDTSAYQRQDDQEDKRKEKKNKRKKQDDTKKQDNNEKQDKKAEPGQPVISEVPKARKQSRPVVVVKPKIKMKPIKVIRPKIKRP